MNKFEFISAVSENGGISHDKAYKAITLVIETLRKALSEGENVEIGCFGTFCVNDGVPVFITGKVFKTALSLSSEK